MLGIASRASSLRAKLLQHAEAELSGWLSELQQLKSSALSSSRGRHAVSFYFGPIGHGVVILEAKTEALLELRRRGCTTAGPAVADNDEQEEVKTCAEESAEVMFLYRTLVAAVEAVAAESNSKHTQSSGSLESEILFGIAGTLHCARRLHALGSRIEDVVVKGNGSAVVTKLIPDLVNAMRSLCEALLERGCVDAAEVRRKRSAETSAVPLPPLSWTFHGKRYLGAAHGSTGILAELVSCYHLLSDADQGTVMATVDWLVNDIARTCNGVLPTTCDSQKPQPPEALLHWCHGTPGLVLLLLQVCQLPTPLYPSSLAELTRRRNESAGLVDALLAKVVFPNGALLKGGGLCHGLAGNGYLFVSTYRVLRKERYLYYAARYAQLSATSAYQEAVARYTDGTREVGNIPDTPFSLMEGNHCGMLMFLAALCSPDTSAFPGFEVPSGMNDPLMPLDMLRRTDTVPPLLRPLCSKLVGFAKPLQGHCFGTTDAPAATTSAALAPADPPPPAVIVSKEILPSAVCAALVASVLSTVTRDQLVTAPVRIPIGDRSPYGAILHKLTGYVQQLLSVYPSLTHRPDRNSRRCHAAIDKQFMTMWSGKYWDLDRRRNSASGIRIKIMRAYMVRYDPVHHSAIHTHTDASHLTLNVCLQKDDGKPAASGKPKRSFFDRFTSPRSSNDETKNHGNVVIEAPVFASYSHVPGDALIFRGDCPHHTHALVNEGSERIQLVILYEFLEDDGPLIQQCFAHPPTIAALRGGVNETLFILGHIAMFLPLRDVATLMSCGSRMWNHVFHVSGAPSATRTPMEQQANYWWKLRLLTATPRVSQWLPVVWPQYFGEGRRGFETLRQYLALGCMPCLRTLDAADRAFVRNSRALRNALGKLQEASLIRHESRLRSARKADVYARSATTQSRTGKAVAFAAENGDDWLDDDTIDDTVRNDAGDELAGVSAWDGVDDCILWKQLLQHGFAFASLAEESFRGAPALYNSRTIPSRVVDDETDDSDGHSSRRYPTTLCATGVLYNDDCATGSSYTSPEVIRELRSCAEQGKDAQMALCYVCTDALEKALDRHQSRRL